MTVTNNTQACRTVLFLALALAVGSCAPLQPPNATGPKGNEAAYPILFAGDANRTEAAGLALNQLIQQTDKAGTFASHLQPITATIRSLPSDPRQPLSLPKVGAEASMNEEETREALRRFIGASRELIGADPVKLSLIERLDQSDGSRLAIYEQRPFRYPIRGNFGKLEIRFTTDRRIINISSTCIPQAERIQTALAATNVRLKAEEAVRRLIENGIIYKDASGNVSTYRIKAASELNTPGLVIYILASKTQRDSLEFHLAWEIQAAAEPTRVAYVDAVTGETIVVE